MNTMLLRIAVELTPGAGVPDAPPTAPPDVSERFNEIIGFAKWIAIAVCVLAFIAAAVVWAFGSDRPGHGPERLMKPLVAVALVSGAAGIVGFFI